MNKYQDEFNNLMHTLWVDINMNDSSYCGGCQHMQFHRDPKGTGGSPAERTCEAVQWQDCPEMQQAFDDIKIFVEGK